MRISDWSSDVCSSDLLDTRNSASAPIAIDGTLYFATGHSIIHAVEAATGKELWTFDSKAVEAAGVRLRQGWGSRGIAWWGGKIYTGTQDRAEERRVGKGCVRRVRDRGSPYNKKKKNNK